MTAWSADCSHPAFSPAQDASVGAIPTLLMQRALAFACRVTPMGAVLRQHGVLEAACALVTFAAAVLVYLNTLPAAFVFDDNFAVVYNGDVTNNNSPVSHLFRNDFWGQNIRSEQSHKSYRPLTVLVFRLTRQLWQALPTSWTGAVHSFRKTLSHDAPNDPEEYRGRQRAEGLDPLLFHAANVLLHGLVSVLVSRLAYCLYRKRAALLAAQRAHQIVLDQGVAAEATGASGPAGTAVDTDLVQDLEQALQWTQVHAPSWLSALAFALHPVHTEAVAGIVGQAEILCALLCLPALLLYIDASDRSRVGTWHDGRLAGLRHWLQVAAVVLLTWASALCKEIGITILAPMICYDLLLVVEPPFQVWAGPAVQQGRPGQPQAGQKLGRQGQEGREGKGVSGEGSAEDVKAQEPPPSAVQAIRLFVLQRRWLRLLILCLAGFLYVRTRSVVAGDQLVRIYRKVENPIAFMPSPLSRALATVQLHWRYIALLLWPVHLSADWSFECVPIVGDLKDVRNIPPAALYCLGLAIALSTRPWALPGEWMAAAAAAAGPRAHAPHARPSAVAPDNSDPPRVTAAAAPLAAGQCRPVTASVWPLALPSPAPSLHRWRAVVFLGLMAAPFLPSSNILFFVGTYIGERLLYLPSVGYCLLLGDALAAALALGWGVSVGSPACHEGRTASQAATGGNGNGAAEKLGPGMKSSMGSKLKPAPSPDSARDPLRQQVQRLRRTTRLKRAARWLRVPLLLACVAGLAWYAGRTYRRNWDWLSEETLFLSAQKVCWRSAKVQLNSGILERRRQNLPTALKHFMLARQIEPGFCEPDYWVGVTQVNLGQAVQGLQELESALNCKYVAQEALKALNTIYQVMLQADPTSGLALYRWGRVLVMPAVGRTSEGCSTLEAAALGFANARDTQSCTKALDACLEALAGLPHATSNATITAAAPTNMSAASLAAMIAASAAAQHACVSSRRAVYLAIASHGPTSRATRLACYQYLQVLRRSNPASATACRSDGPGFREDGKPTAHMQLIHAVQALDAEDPWLQMEWGETMLQQGRVREAALHISVGAMLLARAGGASAGLGHTAAGAPEPKAMTLKGDRLTAFAALEAAAAAYDRASQLGVMGIGDATPCEMRLRAADARVSALSGPAAATGTAGAQAAQGMGSPSAARKQEVSKQLLKGLDEMAGLPECNAQRQLVSALRQRYTNWQQQQKV